MNKKIVTTAVCGTAIVMLLFISACRKSSPSVIGIWTFNKEIDTVKSATGVVISDTSIISPAGETLNLSGQGICATYIQNIIVSGIYTNTSDSLTLYLSGDILKCHINILTDHNMQLYTVDTFSYSPVTLINRYYYYTR